MRPSIFAIVVAGSAVAFPAMAQQQPGPEKAAPSEQTSKQMHQDRDKAMKPNGGQASQQTLAPGKTLNDQTTGSNSGTTGGKAYDK